MECRTPYELGKGEGLDGPGHGITGCQRWLNEGLAIYQMGNENGRLQR